MTGRRILHVCQPSEGGVAAVVRDFATRQTRLGLEVGVACPQSKFAIELNQADVQVHKWEAERAPGLSMVSETLALRRIIKEFQPDVAHLHSSKAGLIGRLATSPNRQPIIFQPHAWSFQASDSILARFSKFWEQLATTRTTSFVIVSKDELELARFATSKARVIRNGIDPHRYFPIDRQSARAALNLPDAPIVLCPGRVCLQKGQDLLLKRWQEVRKARPGALLLIVGDGPERVKWKTRWENNSVLWRGNQDDLNLYYSAANVVAVPSRWEGMALIPLEAMAAGSVVIGSNVGGMRESIGDCGFVVDDMDSMVRTICQLIGDTSKTEMVGNRARQRVLDLFTAQSRQDAVLDLYSEVLA